MWTKLLLKNKISHRTKGSSSYVGQETASWLEHYPLLKSDFVLVFHAPQNCHSQRILFADFQRLLLCTCVFFLFDSLFSPSTFPLLKNQVIAKYCSLQCSVLQR